MIDGIAIGKELRALRARNDMSGEEVAKKAGIHVNSLYKYEKDASRLNVSTLIDLLRIYNVSEETFFKSIHEYVGLNK